MIDHLESLKIYSTWVGGEDERLHVSVGLFKAIDAAIEEMEKLRMEAEVSRRVIQKWAAERIEMTSEIERLKTLWYMMMGEGWKLVPVEPTDEMLAAVRADRHPNRPDGWDITHAKMYRKMLSVAPTPGGFLRDCDGVVGEF